MDGIRPKSALGTSRPGRGGGPAWKDWNENMLDSLLKALPALRNPTIARLAQPGWVAVETVIDERVVREIIPQLKSLGAEGIIEYPLNKVVL